MSNDSWSWFDAALAVADRGRASLFTPSPAVEQPVDQSPLTLSSADSASEHIAAFSGASLVDVSAALGFAGPEDVVAILSADEDLLGDRFAPAPERFEDAPGQPGLVDPFDDFASHAVTPRLADDDVGSTDDDLFGRLGTPTDDGGQADADAVDDSDGTTSTSGEVNAGSDGDAFSTIASTVDDVDQPWDVGGDLGLPDHADADPDRLEWVDDETDDETDDQADGWDDDAG